MTTYPAGQTVQLRETFTNAATGAVADPSTIALKVRAPDGTDTSYAYPATIAKESTGVYYATVALTAAGVWRYAWSATGAVAAVGVGSLTADANTLLGYASRARSTLLDLVQQVRGLTYASDAEYSVGTANYWDDVQVQAVLDRHRRDFADELLTPWPVRVGGGSIQYTEYRARRAQLEQTLGGTALFVVRDAAGSAAGTATYSVDYQRGIVTFGADQKGTAYLLTGRTFDLYGTAAELLRAWAGREKLAYDFTADNQTFRRGQRFEHMLAMAAEYERQAWPTQVSMTRSDVPSAGGGRDTGSTGGAAHPARG